MNKTPRLLIKAAASAGLEAGSLAPNASAAADQAGAAEKAQARQGRRRATASWVRPDFGALPRRPARRLEVVRFGGQVRPRPPEETEGARKAHGDSAAVRPPLPGKCRRDFDARSVADALHVFGGAAHGGEDPAGAGLPRGADLRGEREQRRRVSRARDGSGRFWRRWSNARTAEFYSM